MTRSQPLRLLANSVMALQFLRVACVSAADVPRALNPGWYWRGGHLAPRPHARAGATCACGVVLAALLAAIAVVAPYAPWVTLDVGAVARGVHADLPPDLVLHVLMNGGVRVNRPSPFVLGFPRAHAAAPPRGADHVAPPYVVFDAAAGAARWRHAAHVRSAAGRGYPPLAVLTEAGALLLREAAPGESERCAACGARLLGERFEAEEHEEGGEHAHAHGGHAHADADAAVRAGASPLCPSCFAARADASAVCVARYAYAVEPPVRH